MAFHSKYVCQQCGYESTGWLGKCPNCGEWNTLVETIIENSRNPKSKNSKQISNSLSAQSDKSQTIKLSDIKSASIKRISTNISELDRVLGGGLVPGQAVLIAGEPGIGKSTLLTQLASNLSNLNPKSQSSVLYVCGEESATQVKVRADRLGITGTFRDKKANIDLLEETNVDSIINTIYNVQDHVLTSIIIDSIQTMTTDDLSGMAGSVGQVRECANRLLHAAKSLQIPLFLVGHVTKEGTVAGPAVLSHIVDTVLWFEGDKTLTTRILRAVKNRFGPTDEVGVFEMADKGLISTNDISKAFIDKKTGLPAGGQVSGSIVTSVMQGTRPILVEIQALVVPTKLAIPRRVAQGIDSRRLELLLAVLTRRCGLPLYDNDVFVNVAGGFKITEPASDLAICLAVASAFYDKPISEKMIAVGEVGLLGEVREVVAEEKRIKEAKRLGFSEPVSSREFKYLNEAINKSINRK